MSHTPLSDLRPFPPTRSIVTSLPDGAWGSADEKSIVLRKTARLLDLLDIDSELGYMWDMGVEQAVLLAAAAIEQSIGDVFSHLDSGPGEYVPAHVPSPTMVSAVRRQLTDLDTSARAIANFADDGAFVPVSWEHATMEMLIVMYDPLLLFAFFWAENE